MSTEGNLRDACDLLVCIISDALVEVDIPEIGVMKIQNFCL